MASFLPFPLPFLMVASSLGRERCPSCPGVVESLSRSGAWLSVAALSLSGEITPPSSLEGSGPSDWAGMTHYWQWLQGCSL